VEGDILSGDLFISVDRVKENAIEYDVIWTKELYRVIFHGLLHLVGYNDKTDEEVKIMREKEDFYLSEVDFKEIEL
jgi:rRNA maturation RNase YbeY